MYTYSTFMYILGTSKLLAQMQAADRGLRRLDAILDKTGAGPVGRNSGSVNL